MASEGDKDVQRTAGVIPEKQLHVLWVAYMVDRGTFSRHNPGPREYLDVLNKAPDQEYSDKERQIAETIAESLTFRSVMADGNGLDVMKRDLKALGTLKTVPLPLGNCVLIRANTRGVRVIEQAEKLLSSERIDVGALISDAKDAYREKTPKSIQSAVKTGKAPVKASINQFVCFNLKITLLGPARVLSKATYKHLFEKDVSREFLVAGLATETASALVTTGIKRAAMDAVFQTGQECVVFGLNYSPRTFFAISVAATSIYTQKRAHDRWKTKERLEGWLQTAQAKVNRETVTNASAVFKGHVSSAGTYVVDRVSDFV